MASDGVAPTIETTDKFEDEFTLVGWDGVPFIVRWQWSPSQPTRRPAGVTGWASHAGEVIRVHVCARSPCAADYRPSEYGNVPVPRHGRLPPPAVVGPGPDPDPPLPPPEAEPDPDPLPDLLPDALADPMQELLPEPLPISLAASTSPPSGGLIPPGTPEAPQAMARTPYTWELAPVPNGTWRAGQYFF